MPVRSRLRDRSASPSSRASPPRCPSSPPTSALWPLPAATSDTRFPGWWRHIVHHQQTCVAVAGEHHRGRPGAQWARDRPYVRRRQNLLGHGGGGDGRVSTPRPNAPSPTAIAAADAKAAVRQRDWRLTSGLVASRMAVRRCAGGSAVVAAETTAIVSRTARTSSLKAAATGEARRPPVGRCRLVHRRTQRSGHTG